MMDSNYPTLTIVEVPSFAGYSTCYMKCPICNKKATITSVQIRRRRPDLYYDSSLPIIILEHVNCDNCHLTIPFLAYEGNVELIIEPTQLKEFNPPI